MTINHWFCFGLLAMTALADAAVVGPAPGATVDGAQAATTLEVNPSGIGQVNLVPYYTVLSGFDTYLNIVNTDTRNGKVVKVRFRSSASGENVGNFTVLLGPGDKWAAALTRDAATGYPRVAHNDKSCTLPANVKVTLGPTYFQANNGDKVEDVRLAQDGSVEIITLADIPPLTALNSATTTATGTSGPSCSTSALNPLATDSTSYADARSKGLEVPTSGLMTQWTLINVPRAVSYTGRATAVEARVAAGGPPGYGNVVLFPQTSAQITDAARTVSYSTDPSFAGWTTQNLDGVFSPVVGGSSYVESQLPDLSTPYLPAGLGTLAQGAAARQQAYAISEALATHSIDSEFVTEPAILAKTDWVVTLPTRYLQVALTPGGMTSLPAIIVSNFTMDNAGQPIGSGAKNYFISSINLNDPYSVFPVCVMGVDPFSNGTPTAQPQTETAFRTHEGTPFNLQPDASDTSPFRLCGQSMVLRFAKAGDDPANGALGDARNRRSLVTPNTAGWGRIQIPGVSGRGLPIIGFAVSELYNSAVAPGVAGAFGQTFPLGTTKPAP